MMWKLMAGVMAIVAFVAMSLLFAQGERELAERREYHK